MREMLRRLSQEYDFEIRRVRTAKRGFFGETWKLETDAGDYFLKIDFWKHHQESYRSSLAVVEYMSAHGIPFIPRLVKTRCGKLYCIIRHGIAAVFEYVQGENREDYPLEQLFGRLAQVYRLDAAGVRLGSETFGTEILDRFRTLRNAPALPSAVKKALDAKQAPVFQYSERLKLFSEVCRGSIEDFHITHGDAGGNCILNKDDFFIVDWDSVMYAPIERDAWFFMYEDRLSDRVHSVLLQNGIECRFRPECFCYYCYYSFFYYLTEYMQSLLSAADDEQKYRIAGSLLEYLSHCWIYKRLEAADRCEAGR